MEKYSFVATIKEEINLESQKLIKMIILKTNIILRENIQKRMNKIR